MVLGRDLSNKEILEQEESFQEGHSDFRSLQAKFQASQPEPSELPKKPPKPEFNKLPKKFPQPESGEHPKKASQPEVTNRPRKPSQPDFNAGPKKFPPLETCSFPKKLLQPEFSETPRKPLQLEPSNPTRPPSEPKFSAPPRKLWPPESSEATLKPPQLEFGTFPKKPPPPESVVHPRKLLQPQVSSLPKKPLPQPEFSEAPQMGPSRPEHSEPHPHSPKPELGAFPKKGDHPRKPPQPECGDRPRKPPQPEFGDLIRIASEPEVSMFPKRPQQPELHVLHKKAPQAELGSLPRTASEPEFNSLPRKFLQPEGHKLPRKLSQPEACALPRKHPQGEFLGDLPRKPPLPGSVSESSLPTATGSSGARFPLSPGFRTPLGGQRRLGALAHSGGVRSGHPPRRRPLPPACSLGPPPPKPPLPPGPPDIQSFWRPSAASATALQRSRSAAALHSHARQPAAIPQDSEELYELYDDVEPEVPRLGSRDEVAAPPQQGPRRPPQDLELRKEKAPQPQQLPPADLKSLKQMRKAEKAEREFRKKFKFEGEIVIQTRMMIDPNAKTRRGGGKHLGIRRGEILEVIEFTSKEEMLCRDAKGKYGYVPRTALLPLETEVYDDVGFWDPLDSQPLPQGQ
ncbi:PML-RARA-regulated adapter molecule 1 [Orycteropus afer afer]|uniref:PML-RARA-regulated adapter molecule 1 n=1 Tax=Orycteropus afer afer TaxID=1230840 RepID=A0A8B7AWE4_ORYAF|nr:PML-RARA-regulated adapter molecule 1 [Orycteropus afer afer]